jgi:hypothetical protein
LTGTMHLAQAAFILATGRVPSRAIPKAVVPRATAIWPFLVAMGFWCVGWVLWSWNERRSGPKRETQGLGHTGQVARRSPGLLDPGDRSNHLGGSTSPATEERAAGRAPQGRR